MVDTFFSGAEISEMGNFTVVKENDVSYALIQELISYNDENGNGQLDPDEEVTERFNLIIFVSKDASYLQKARDNYYSDDMDLCLFIEDNSTDSVSGRFGEFSRGDVREDGYHIFAGAVVRGILEEWLKKGVREFRQLQRELGFHLHISRRQLKTLIETGELEQANPSMIRTIFGLVNKVNLFAGGIYDAIGDVVLEATKMIRDYIKFDDFRWDPDAKVKNEAGEEVENPNFTPFLIPFGHEIIDELAEIGTEGTDTVIAKLRKRLLEEKQDIRGRLNGFHRVRGVRLVLRKDLKDFMEKCADYIFDLLDRVLDTCGEIVPFIASMGKKWLNMVNAFYCGLWNAMVEAILGLVDLVGYLFKGMAFVYNTSGNIGEILPQALELIDETYQAIVNADYRSIFSETMSAIVAGLKGIDLSGFGASITLEKISYYVGAFVGFVIEILVGMGSGGITSLKAAFTKMGKFTEDLFSFIVRMASGVVRESVEISLEGLMALARKIIELIKAGGAKIAELINSIFAAIRRGFRTLEEFIAEIMRMFKLTRAQIDEAGRLGMDFTGLYDEFCTLCKAAN